MAITPVDILHTEFKTALRGYNKSQVDEFVRAVTDALEATLREKAELQRRIDFLQDEVERVRKMEATVAEALTLAQKTADEVKASAHKQAELILAEAEQSRVKLAADTQGEVEKLRAEVALVQSARERFEAEFRALLTSYLDCLDQRKPEPRREKKVA